MSSPAFEIILSKSYREHICMYIKEIDTTLTYANVVEVEVVFQLDMLTNLLYESYAFSS